MLKFQKLNERSVYYCHDTTWPSGHDHIGLFATDPIGHTHGQLHVAHVQEFKEYLNYH